MIYLNDEDINNLPFSWRTTVDVIEQSVCCIDKKDYVQPIKTYLRYSNLANRIIAMPAYAGGGILRSGLKWIASFPENVNKGMKRAHSVLVLNEFDTGKPVSIINSGTLSSIRTASVSGFLIQKVLQHRLQTNIKLGIIGFGPIGYQHLMMAHDLLKSNLAQVAIFDLNPVSLDGLPKTLKEKVNLVNQWEDAYLDTDLFITCTVSKFRYIDQKPKLGSLHLNVSLRDYTLEVLPWFRSGGIVVDNWEEVCRENTDIEQFHLKGTLQEKEVAVIQDLLQPATYLDSLPIEQPIMFNPMGMAVFDIGIADYFLNLAQQKNIGTHLE